MNTADAEQLMCPFKTDSAIHSAQPIPCVTVRCIAWVVTNDGKLPPYVATGYCGALPISVPGGGLL